jgi:predicted HTH domain antitoxin
MHTLTADELNRRPEQLIDHAQRGEVAVVTMGGELVMMTVPLGKGVEFPAVRLELAVSLYDRDEVSLGLAAQIAGIPYGEMIDELGQRGMPVVRYSDDELSKELDYVRTLAGRG